MTNLIGICFIVIVLLGVWGICLTGYPHDDHTGENR